MGLVVLDVVGLFHHHVREIRKTVEDLEFTHVMVASTHTHGGTDTLGLWGPNRLTDGTDPRFIAHIIRRSELALREAFGKIEPARVRLAKTTPPQQFGLLINDLRDPIVIDDQILVMALDNRQGEPIATLVNWTPHPETIGGASSRISSDFPHYLRESIEEGDFRALGRRWTGRGGLAMYVSGSLGGLLSTLRLQIFDEDGRPLALRSYAKAQRIGQLVGAAVLSALSRAEPVEIHGIDLQSKTLFIPIENPLFKMLLSKGVLKREAYTNGKPAGTKGEDVRTEVNVLTLFGPDRVEAQFVTVPGELFPEIAIGGYLADEKKCWRYTQRKRRLDGRGKERIAAAHPDRPTEPVLKDHMKGRLRFIIGLGNDELGYIVPGNDFIPPVAGPRIRYGTDRCGDRDHYEETMSVGPQAAPRITESLVELLGRVHAP